MSKAINQESIANFRSNKYGKNNSTIKNAVNNLGIKSVSENFEQKNMTHDFSIEIKTGKVSNQKRSGRCWLFSTLTNLRREFAENYKIKDFELSENYLSFWDRLEKANYFYKNVLDTASEDLDSRKVSCIFNDPNGDGGQWQYSVNLIEKYGVVPFDIMPETTNSVNTTEFNKIMGNTLRKNGLELRKMVANNASEGEIEVVINKNLSEIYRLCVYAFGEPVEEFDLFLRDDDDKIIANKKTTPLDFYNEYFTKDLNNYQSVMNTPQKDKEYGKTYNIDTQGNIIGGKDEKFLNLPMERLTELAIEQLKDGDTVWFGNDVSAQSNRQKGVLSDGLYDTDQVFDVNSKMTKAERLDTGEGQVSHAMVLTGVDLDSNGKPTKWKVENSWGDKVGKDGYFVMDQAWFEQYCYEVVINKKYLTADELKASESEPIVLPAWDAMA